MDPIAAQLAEEGMVFAGVIIAMACCTLVAFRRFKPGRASDVAAGNVARRLDEIAAQLSRVESAIEASSVEIERISEGQRFTTRVLAERTAPAQAEQPGGSAKRVF